MYCRPVQTLSRLLIPGVAVVCIVLFEISPNPPARQPELRHAQLRKFANMPLPFEANQGQTDTNVQFVSRGFGYTVFLTSDGATLSLERPESRSVLQLRLAGAQPLRRGIPSEVLPGRSNYFIGNDPSRWRTNIAHYGRISFQDVLPGIDLTYYGRGHQLEYDFVVRPGSDPTSIRMTLKGQRNLTISNDGDLSIRLANAVLRLHRPLAYQAAGNDGTKQHSVKVQYVLYGPEEIGFEVADYDHGRTLVIDPVVSYSTFLGGTSLDGGNGIAVDSSGAVYVTGETSSIDFPVSSASYQQNNAGGSDVFVAKLDPTGALVYATYIGGELSERGSGIAVDANGNACVTGRTNSTAFPTVNYWQNQLLGDFDAFVTQLNSQGNALTFSTYLGGSGNDEGSGIAVDSSGFIYVTGGTSVLSQDDFPTTTGAFQRLFGGGMNDGFVTKLDPTQSGPAALVYSTFLGGGGIDRGNSIAVDSSGNAYVTGRTSSTDFPTANAQQGTFAGGQFDAFVTELDSTASNIIFSTFLGGAGSDQAYGIALDSTNEVYLTGVTDSANFPTVNAYQIASGGSTDTFFAKLGAGGSPLVYSTYFGGSAAELGASIAIDSSGVAYITGRTDSAIDFPVSPDAIQPLFGGGPNDAFIAKIDPSALGTNSLIYSSYIGGTNDENIPSPGPGGNPAGGIAVDSSGNAYVTGNTSSTDFLTVNAYQPFYAGDPSDAFILKLAFPMTGGGNFSVGVNLDRQTVVPGGTANYTITAFPSGGFTGNVALSISGVPASSTANFNPPSITITDASAKSSTLSVMTDPATPEGSYPLSVVGTNGSLHPRVPPVLNVSTPTGTADLSLAKTGSPNPVTVNSTLTYRINVRSNGPGTATGVTMTDSLPATLNNPQITTQRGSCSLGPPASCSIGVLGIGEGAVITITGNPTVVGQIQNTAQVSGDQIDPDTSNNSAIVTNLVETPRTGSPAMLDPSLTVNPVITGLNEPTGIAFLGPNDFLVIEKSPRAGAMDANVLRVTNGMVTTILQLPVNSAVERGLLGIALHPNFPATPYIYLYWTCRGPEAGDHCDASAGAAADVSKVPLRGNRVDRYIWDGSTLIFDQNLITLRSYQSDEGQSLRGNHNGGKIVFGPDGTLYILIGDNGRRGYLQNVQIGTFSDGVHDDQFGGPDPDNNHLTGVILRLNDDGSTPPDNPFFAVGANMGGEDGANIQKIFAYGVRNSFGMAFDPMSGNLWNEENGDDSFDEINMVPPGANNGWIQIMGPVSRIADYKAIETSPAYFGLQQIRWSPERIADTPDAAMASLLMLAGATYNDPRFSWKYSVAPSPIGFAGPGLGPFAGDMFVGAARTFLEGGYLFNFKMTSDRSDVDLTQDPRLADRVADNNDKFDITESESLLIGRDFGITTDIQTGPDGNLFVVSLSNSTGANASGGVYEVSLSSGMSKTKQ